ALGATCRDPARQQLGRTVRQHAVVHQHVPVAGTALPSPAAVVPAGTAAGTCASLRGAVRTRRRSDSAQLRGGRGAVQRLHLSWLLAAWLRAPRRPVAAAADERG